MVDVVVVVVVVLVIVVVVECSISSSPDRHLVTMSSSLDNQIIRPGSLFGKLRKQGDGFVDAGTFFKFDFHPEEKLAMSASLDY